MIITVLGTGSEGNAIVVESGDDRVMIDAGFPARTLARRLRSCGIAPESIRALVLTHAHSDHSRGARVAARRFGWRVFASRGTLAALPELRAVSPVVVQPSETIKLDTLSISPLSVPHDCAEPIALRVEASSTGARVGVALDLGHVPLGLVRELEELDALVLESNHDEWMLRHGPYPRSLQRRIAGANGHLSNRTAARLVRYLASRNLSHVVLAHLSQENNTPEVAHDTMLRGLKGTDFKGTLSVAAQHTVTRVTVARARKTEQISLFG